MLGKREPLVEAPHSRFVGVMLQRQLTIDLHLRRLETRNRERFAEIVAFRKQKASVVDGISQQLTVSTPIGLDLEHRIEKTVHLDAVDVKLFDGKEQEAMVALEVGTRVAHVLLV